MSFTPWLSCSSPASADLSASGREPHELRRGKCFLPRVPRTAHSKVDQRQQLEELVGICNCFWQVPVGTRLYGLMPAARHGSSILTHVLQKPGIKAGHRYQVQTVGRDPKPRFLLLKRGLLSFLQNELKVAPFLARKGSPPTPAPMILYKYLMYLEVFIHKHVRSKNTQMRA